MSNVDKSISNVLAKYVSDCFQQRKETNIVWLTLQNLYGSNLSLAC
jgi:hypothetical protein